MNLRDLIHTEQLHLTVVAAEPEQIDRDVTSAYITDLPDPSRFLSVGDVVLTSGMWLTGPEAIERFVAALVRQQVAALVVGLVQIGHLPDVLLEVCRRERLTLLTISDRVSFKQVVDAVALGVAGPGEGLAQRALDFSRRLAEVQARGEGPQALLSEFRAGFAVSCWLIDALGTLRAVSGDAPDREQLGFVWNAMLEHGPGDGVVLVARTAQAESAGQAPEKYTCWPVGAADGHPLGSLVCAGDQRRLVRDLPIVMDSLVGALRIDLEFADRWREHGNTHVSDLVRVLAGDSVSPGEISARMRLEGLEPQHPTIVVVAEVADQRFPPGTVLDMVHRMLAEDGVRVVGAVVGHQAVLLANGKTSALEEETLPRWAEEWLPLLNGRQLRVGASDARSGVGQLATAYESAQSRLAQLESGAPVAVATTSEIHTYRALFAQLSDSASAGFARDVLRPLREYDTRHGAELISTLRVFLANSGAWQESARQLHLHTNTLRYRIARVEELTGRSLNQMDDRVDIYLALQLSEG